MTSLVILVFLNVLQSNLGNNENRYAYIILKNYEINTLGYIKLYFIHI